MKYDAGGMGTKMTTEGPLATSTPGFCVLNAWLGVFETLTCAQLRRAQPTSFFAR